MLTDSWLIIRNENGQVVYQTTNELVAAAINKEKFSIAIASAYLAKQGESHAN